MKLKVLILIAALAITGVGVNGREGNGSVGTTPQDLSGVKGRAKAGELLKSGQNIVFTENKGQIKDQYGKHREDIDFKIIGKGVNVFVGDGKIHYQWVSAADKNVVSPEAQNYSLYRMDVELIGANSHAAMVTAEKQMFFEQYFSGDNAVRVNTYKRITYKDVYPNIDWVFYFNSNGKLEHDFIVRPGGKVSDIRIRYGGSTGIKINLDGSLTATTPMGAVTESAPRSYVQGGIAVASSFNLKDNVLSFKTAAHTGTLVIDPTLEWCTYYGTPYNYDDNLDQTAIRLDPKGNIYIAGVAAGSMTDIATVGSYQSTVNISDPWEKNQFLVKMTSAGQRLWATYYGRDVFVIGTGLACDKNGNVYLSGGTKESAGIATAGSHQSAYGGGTELDAYLVKFDSTGQRQWATYYGGSGEDISFALQCDTAGNIFMCGRTKSTTGIATPNSHKNNLVGTQAFFLAKFNSAGVRQWGTYYGEHATFEAGWKSDMTMAGDESGNVYFLAMIGIYPATTQQPAEMTTANSHQPVHGGLHDALLVKFNNNGGREWATYYGGDEEDLMTREGLTCDKWGNLYLLGATGSASGIATPGSHQTVLAGGGWWPEHMPGDGFLVKFNSAGVRQWGTYYGGTESDNSFGYGGVGCDIFGNVLIGGETTSNTAISTPGSYQAALLSAGNGYLVKFDSTGVRKWGTYFGGIAEGRIETIASNDSGQIFIAGYFNDYANLATPGAHQSLITPLFIAKFDDCSDIVSAADTILGDITICAGGTGTYSVSTVPGAGSYNWILPSGWTGSSSTNSINVTANSTNGIIGVAAVFSCGSGDTTYLNVTAVPLPVPVITASGNVLSTGTYASYQWKLNGADIPGAVNATHTAAVTGNYTVTVTDANGCSGTSTVYNHTLTSITEPLLNNLVKIFPNPATTWIKVSSPVALKINIAGIEGKIILSENIAPGTSSVHLDNLASGIYLIQVMDKDGRLVKTEKLVKQ
jgi:hypothetical protein